MTTHEVEKFASGTYITPSGKKATLQDKAVWRHNLFEYAIPALESKYEKMRG